MQVTILAIRRGENIIVSPGPDEKIGRSDILVVLGRNDNIEVLSNLD